jgi:predicted acetyltransferase
VEGTRIELIAQNPNEAKQAAGAANVRVTLVDEATGSHLSWATVIDQELRFGSSSFLCGGIGGVATPEEHRRHGYSTIVMKAAVQYMRTQGYPMTYLFGINNYYEGEQLVCVLSCDRLGVCRRGC